MTITSPPPVATERIRAQTVGLPRTIWELIADAKRQIGPVGKTDWNEQQHFKFRGVDAVINAVAPVFDQLGIIHAPELLEYTYQTVEIGSNRTRMGHVRLTVRYNFQGPGGPDAGVIPATVPGEAMDVGDKATSKAMSVALRTALIQTLNLPTADRDPDADSYEQSEAWDKRITKIASREDAIKLDNELHEAFDAGAVTAQQATVLRQAIMRMRDKFPAPPAPPRHSEAEAQRLEEDAHDRAAPRAERSRQVISPEEYGTQASPPAKPMSKKTLGEIERRLGKLPLGEPADVMHVIRVITAAAVKKPEELTAAQAGVLLSAFDKAMAEAEGDSEQAAHLLWAQVKTAGGPARPDVKSGKAADA
jgi:ERF superfamily